MLTFFIPIKHALLNIYLNAAVTITKTIQNTDEISSVMLS